MTVITVSGKKFKTNNRENHERITWGKLLISACSAYGKILDNHELTQIQKDIDEIKEKLGLR